MSGIVTCHLGPGQTRHFPIALLSLRTHGLLRMARMGSVQCRGTPLAPPTSGSGTSGRRGLVLVAQHVLEDLAERVTRQVLGEEDRPRISGDALSGEGDQFFLGG